MKKLILLITAAALLLTLAACGGKREPVIDIEKLAAELLEKGEFTEELAEVDERIVAALYGVEGAVAQKVYISGGATAEELAIFDFPGDREAKAGLELVRQRLESQKTEFGRYIPAEVPKLEAAVLEQAGKYVIFCVSGGPTAEEIVRSYL